MKSLTSADKMRWLPDMDLNHDKQIQSLLCYRYTIGQTRNNKVEICPAESSVEPKSASAPLLAPLFTPDWSRSGPGVEGCQITNACGREVA